MVVTTLGEAVITNMLMPDYTTYSSLIGWQISKIYVYSAPNNKKPLKKTIDEAAITSQNYSYTSNVLTKTSGLVQFQQTITIGNGNTLYSIAIELDQIDSNGTDTAHHYSKIIWEKLPAHVKTASTDFTLVTNIYIKRL